MPDPDTFIEEAPGDPPRRDRLMSGTKRPPVHQLTAEKGFRG
jgi:hypothetical protein